MQSLKKSVVIIGAGLSGLSCAYHLQKAGHDDFLLIEKESEAGGLARTENFEGFYFDHSIHILYTKDSYAKILIKDLLQDNLKTQARESYCYSDHIYTEYPYQTNQYGLPVEIIADNILNLILARYDFRFKSEDPKNFEEWLYKTFGKAMAERFMIPYNFKQWAWDLKDMTYDWIANRVPLPSIKETLLGALRAPEKKVGPNREFWYPKTGGIEALSRNFLRLIEDSCILQNQAVCRIDAQRRMLHLQDGNTVGFEHLISTVPLPLLIRLLGEAVPQEIQKSAAALQSNRVYTVNIGLEGESIGTPRFMHWVYFPDKDILFHRVSFPHHFSQAMVPPGCCSIQAEVSESFHKPVPKESIIPKTLEGLIRTGILKAGEARGVQEGGRIRTLQVKILDPAYIIYQLGCRRHLQILQEYLEKLGIDSCGRFGEWEYFNMDHAILSGKKAAEYSLAA